MWENLTSEESEPDLDLLKLKPKEGTKWTPGWELWKRVAVGFWCLSLYTNMYWAGLFWMKTIAIWIGLLIGVELLGLRRDRTKDALTGQAFYEWTSLLFIAFVCGLKLGLFDWQMLQNSGITRENAP